MAVGHIDDATDTEDLISLVIAEAVEDSLQDGVRRVVGIMDHPDGSGDLVALPEAETRTLLTFWPGWVVDGRSVVGAADSDERMH